MDVFPRAFLLVFCQLAVGGLFCLAIPPFHELERGYYKSSAFVYVGIAALALLGRVALWWGRDPTDSGWRLLEIGLWATFVLSAGGYFASLWGEAARLRARLFIAAWLSGVASLVALAEGYRQAPVLSFETVLFPLSFLLSALLLGAAASGMLLGHWYLIDRDLSLDPLNRTQAVYQRTLTVQAAVLVATAVLLGVAGAPPARAGVQGLLSDQLSLLATRLAISPLGAGALGWMIRRTLDIPQTMAATGLFYIAVLAVLVGEMLGRFLLFRTGLPL
jgi:DMSO reductase anchor subunit